MEVIRSLVVMGKEGTSKKRKLSLPVQMKAHKFSIPGDVRLANAQHLPVRSTSKRCTVCSTKQKPKRTRWMCQTCKQTAAFHLTSSFHFSALPKGKVCVWVLYCKIAFNLQLLLFQFLIRNTFTN
ncbi:hypothetical protein TNCT_268421 [Trichonephila clavata]|uniref:Uncharacterized protein n=1 Tax=Trichonephila clavata TaxID=2740835 RepID=A0A8X6LHR7_TRICU|nr:hypothetical protein TNCT_268421 [Trichonephila clavata]